MPSSLDSLPFDILYLISSSLNLHDYLNFSYASRRYFYALQDESSARKVLQTVLPYSREARLAKRQPTGRIPSYQGLRRVHNIQESIASARPYSLSLLAYGDAFCYSEGFLCYSDGPLVRILNVHSSSRKEKVIDVGSIYPACAARSQQDRTLPLFSKPIILTLHYSDGVLICVCKDELYESKSLVAIYVGTSKTDKKSTTAEAPFAPFCCPLDSSTKLFVRHNCSYLYFGTHSGLRSDTHHEWMIRGLDLKTGKEITKRPIQLNNFVGSDIGSTACFHIQDGDFVAISNQTSFEVEEIDWTSFYHCVRIPLGEESPILQTHVFWQRQHEEGPINDSWTDLAFQRDQRTNELLILECRKEWLGGSSANIRTYYTKPLDFSKDDEALKTYAFPADTPLSKALDHCSKPHFLEPRKRIDRHCHREYELDQLDPNSPTPPRDFILAKSKYRAYNSAAMSFVDLVVDPAKIPKSVRTRDRLRLRIASRRQKSPLIPDPQNPDQSVLRPRDLDSHDLPLEGSEDAFTATQVHLWPPASCPPEIYDILCPSGRVRNIDATSDDRSIIYMTDPSPSLPGSKGAIVMISFDPAWDHQGLRDLKMPHSPALVPCGPEDLRLQISCADLGGGRVSKRSSPTMAIGGGGMEATEMTASATALAGEPSKRRKGLEGGIAGFGFGGIQEERTCWVENAMYRDINLGYRFR